MSIAFTCSEEDFRKARTHLSENGIIHTYYKRKDHHHTTTFHIEIPLLNENALLCIRDYVKENGLTASLEIDAKPYDLTKSDLNDLMKKMTDVQKRGRQVRGYHY